MWEEKDKLPMFPLMDFENCAGDNPAEDSPWSYANAHGRVGGDMG